MSALGRLVASIILDSAEFTAGTDKAKYAAAKMATDVEKSFASMENKVNGVMGSIAGTLAASLSAGAFVHMINGAINAADHLHDLSKTTSVTVETLAGLRIAAKQSGGDLDSIAGSINKLSVNMGKDAEKFRALGISAKDPVEAFKQLADVFVSIQDPQLRAAVGAAALGKSWAGAAPLLAEGSAKIGEMIARGSALSGITTEMAKQADELNDKWVLLVGTGGLVNSMVANMLPLLNLAADGMLALRDGSDKVGAGFNPVTEILRTVIILFGNVGFVFKAVGTTIGTLIAQVAALGDAFSLFATRKEVSAALERFNEIQELSIQQSKDARAAFDKWEEGILNVGTAARSSTKALDAMDQVSRRMSSESAAAARGAAAAAKAFLDGDKAAKEAAAERKRLQDLDNKGWVAYIEAITKEYEDGLHQMAKDSDEFWKNEERLRKLGDEGWVKSIDAQIDEYEKGLTEIAGMRKSHHEETDAIAKRSAGREIGQYAEIAGAAKGFFQEGSRGYKALEAAQKTFEAFQLASDIVTGISKAAVAIANQATQGDPYTAWARMAMMAAAMAAIGFAVSGTGGGGGATAASRQEAQGTGTVLGDTNEKSASLGNALKHVLDIMGTELEYQSSMMHSLVSIDNAMSGLATLVARGAGLSPQQMQDLNLGTRSNMPSAAGYLVGSAGGSLGSLLSGGLTNVMGAIFGALFGNTTRSVTDSGLSIGAQTVGGGRSNFQGSQYADVQSNSSSLFGLIRSSSSSRDTQALNGEMVRQFQLLIGGVADALASAAAILSRKVGPDLEIFNRGVGEFIDSMDIAALDISFKDLKGSELQEALESAFGAMGDDLAGQVMEHFFPSVRDFQRVGEGAFETFSRVASGVERATAVLGQWGITVMDWNDIVERQGDVTTEMIRGSIVAAQSVDGVTSSMGLLIQGFTGSADDIIALYNKLLELGVLLRASAIDTSHLGQELIAAAGGLSALRGGLQAYSEEFFSAEERMAFAHAELLTSFAAIGQEMPSTRAAFRAMVEAAQALGDNALLGRLLALAPAFAELVPALGGAAGAGAVAAAGPRSRYGPYGPTEMEIWEMPESVAARAAALALAKAFDQARVGVGEFLHELLLDESLSPLTPEARLNFAHDAYVENLLKAQGGDLTAMGQDPQLTKEYLKELRATYGSGSEYLQGFAGVVEQQKSLAGLGDAIRPATAADTKAASKAIVDAINRLIAEVGQGNADMPDHLKLVTAPLRVLEQAAKDGASVF